MQDLRLAVRTLIAAPVVSLAAILSLALGAGANSAFFSLIDSLLLRGLPVRDPGRLVMLSSGPTDDRQQYSYVTFDALRKNADAFDGVFAWALPGKVTIGSGVGAIVADDLFVSGEFFPTAGVQPFRGRLIEPGDDVRGGGPDGAVAVISYAFWQRWFGGSADAVGSRLIVERVPLTVIGITPPSFFGVIVGRSFDVALPIQTQPVIRAATPYPEDGPWLRLMLRLKPGQSLSQANAAIRAAQPAIRAARRRIQDPATFMNEPLRLDSVATGVSPLRQQFERPLIALFGVALVVLAIACANVANLMLARGAARRHEMSIRLALGAPRWRLARQLLVESAIVAAAGGAIALLVARWAGRAIVARLSTFMMPIDLAVPLDWRVMAFTVATTAGTALLFGVMPACQAARVEPAAAVQAASRQPGVGTRGAGRFANLLIVGQVAMSLALVVTAVLLVRSFERLSAAPLGFERDRAVVVTVTAPTVPAADRNAFYRRLVRTAQAVPGVAAAGGSMNPPVAGTLVGNFVVSEPGVLPPPDAEQFSQSDFVTAGFVAAYGMTLRAGREFDDRDRLATQPVMMVNEAFARRYIQGGNAVAKSLTLTFRMSAGGDFPLGPKVVVGVVTDSVFRSIREPLRPTVYLPLAQDSSPILTANFYIAARAAAGSPSALTRSLSEALLLENRDLMLTFRPIADQVDASLAQDRLVASLAGFFGALAMLLAMLGLYGVTAYAVARRRVEIGIRMALGAAPVEILRDVLGRVGGLVALGLAVGAAISFGSSRLLASLLYGLSPRDPVTLAAAALALIAVSGLAAYLPARRASRVDPAEVLRES